MTTIAVLVGSLREESWNKKFAQELEKRLPEDVKFVYGDINLPLYNDDVALSAFPQEATALKELVKNADGVLVITPEYNRGLPGLLKNALDWASRPYGDNSFDAKPVAVAGVSSGPIGTAPAQSQLKDVLLYLNAKVMGQPEFYGDASRLFDESGNISEGSEDFVQRFVEAVVAHIAAKLDPIEALRTE